MGNIKGKWTNCETRLHVMFDENGVGHKMHPKLYGNPDALVGNDTVIFVDGCFWHGCPKDGHIPKTNTEYWTRKFNTNKKRDSAVSVELRKQGFNVVRLWECEVMDKDFDIEKLFDMIARNRPEYGVSQ